MTTIVAALLILVWGAIGVVAIWLKTDMIGDIPWNGSGVWDAQHMDAIRRMVLEQGRRKAA